MKIYEILEDFKENCDHFNLSDEDVADTLKQIEQTLLEAMPEEKIWEKHPIAFNVNYVNGYNQALADCIQVIKESMK